jgi:hypothetical protein
MIKLINRLRKPLPLWLRYTLVNGVLYTLIFVVFLLSLSVEQRIIAP